MNATRRRFLQTAAGAVSLSMSNVPLHAALRRGRWDDAADVLKRATAAKQVDAAVLHVAQKNESYTRHFGKAASDDAMFLLGSISKPINVTPVMTLFDREKFQLDDRVKKFLPAFKGAGRDETTIRHLLTHVSGLPDQLANNNDLRKEHAPLTEFAKQAMRARLDSPPAPSTSTRAWGSCWPRGLRRSLADRTSSRLSTARSSSR
jgi:CubicO group peptidase (beta-lactamase class C family)